MDKELEGLVKVYDIAMSFIVNYSFQVLGAIIILLVGAYVSKTLARVVTNFCDKKQIDVTLGKFLGSVTKIVVFAVFVIISLGKFGISIAPFIAAIGAIMFGATLALQGLFSNYAAGLTLILTRPFKLGDTISIQGVTGVVEEIKLGLTELSTEDGEIITIPNKLIVGEILQNSFEFKIVEMVIGIDYGDSPEIAKSAVESALLGHDQVTKEPRPQVGIHNFGESSIDIGFRYWVPTKKYYEARYSANTNVYKSLKDAGITIPYPHREVVMRGNG